MGHVTGTARQASVLKESSETAWNQNKASSLRSRPTTRTCVTGIGSLADSVVELVVFPALGTNMSISAELAVGYAGQAGVATPVRVQSPGAVCPTATLVEVAFLSVFIWGGQDM